MSGTAQKEKGRGQLKTIHFIGIGAQKAGTTFLWNLIQQHPEVCTASTKEIGYFSFLDQDSVLSKKKYLSLFHWNPKKHTVAGEFTPRYLFEPYAPQKIHGLFPDTKLIIVLRNPIDRAMSSYNMTLRNGFRKDRFNSHIFWKEVGKRKDILGMGRYAEQIQRFRKYFDDVQIKILFFEDLCAQPVFVTQEVYKFIGVQDITYTPQEIEKTDKNEAFRITEHLFLFQMRQRIVKWARHRKLHHTKYFMSFMRTCMPMGMFKKKSLSEKQKSILSAEDRVKLRNYYERDIKELEKITGRDLSHWV